MKYTIKHVDKFRENYELNPDNSKVVTNYTEEVTAESIEDFSKILKNFNIDSLLHLGTRIE